MLASWILVVSPTWRSKQKIDLDLCFPISNDNLFPVPSCCIRSCWPIATNLIDSKECQDLGLGKGQEDAALWCPLLVGPLVASDERKGDVTIGGPIPEKHNKQNMCREVPLLLVSEVKLKVYRHMKLQYQMPWTQICYISLADLPQ